LTNAAPYNAKNWFHFREGASRQTIFKRVILLWFP
jgi:hypothetical protein